MRNVLITGTSTGIGRATAVVLASRSWRVFATMRNLQKRSLLEQALGKAGVRNGVEIEQLDLASPRTIQAAVASILSRTENKLDAVVHNAGVAAAGALEDIPEAELRRVMETNFFGVLELTRALLPTFRAQRSGRIVIVSSEAYVQMSRGCFNGLARGCGWAAARPAWLWAGHQPENRSRWSALPR